MKRAIVLLVAVLALSGSGMAPASAATSTEHIVKGQYLTLTSIGDFDAMEHLRPLVPVSWQIGVQAHPPTASRIEIGISVVQPTGPRGLSVDIRACSVRWVSDLCTGAEGTWMWHENLATAAIVVDDNGIHSLGWMESSEERWVLIQATLPGGMPTGYSAAVRLHAWGAGDSVTSQGSTASSLAFTGASLGGPLVLTGLALLGGLGLAGAARRRSRPLGSRIRP